MITVQIHTNVTYLTYMIPDCERIRLRSAMGSTVDLIDLIRYLVTSWINARRGEKKEGEVPGQDRPEREKRATTLAQTRQPSIGRHHRVRSTATLQPPCELPRDTTHVKARRRSRTETMPVPSDSILEKELRLQFRQLIKDGEEVTINKVRQAVEEKLDLPEGFFKDDPDWKGRSKAIIHKAFSEEGSGGEGDNEPEPEPEPAAKPAKKNGIKRQSSEEPEQKPKRVKKEAAPKKPTKKAAPKAKAKPKKKASSDSDLSDLDDSEEEKPKRRGRPPKKKQESESELSDLGSSEEDTKPKKAAARGKLQKKKAVISDEEDGGSDEADSSAERERKRKRSTPAAQAGSKRAKIDSENEGEASKAEEDLAEASDTETKAQSKTKAADSDDEDKPKKGAGEDESKPGGDDDSSELSSVIDEPPPKKKAKKEDSKAAVGDDDDSDLSSVLDEPPPKKRKPREPKGSSKPRATKAAPKELTGDEAEIKKLQGQLVKCGVRKIWGIELKEYGDDTKGKIRHLRKMLSDLGVTGRFSEAKAKEIKERRELMADLEAVNEMNHMWGAEGRGGRASRSRAKATVKEPSSEDESGAEEAKPRVSKRMADLAFLGSDDEESD
ncbi:hypothetical protein JX265_008060 [Neoarthrinium moseri]|uniref:Transcriptional regulator n=1 Tax=Neoarthrinium moseri TaxID=1658444 RepID=A0A9Q0AP03_9PEZI|nr:hypothetical protein JX265_008060 [Neoarthrinium moseri]